MAWPAVKRKFGQEEFRRYVAGLAWGPWRPSKMVLHNTAAPSWAQWEEKAAEDRKAGRVPGVTRIASLENYFRNERKWGGCPHLFIPDDGIWVMNPLTLPGTHTPSWNHNSIGIEMVADFSREDDDSGPGLKVKLNTVFAVAVLCETFGLTPSSNTIKLHKDDPKTTHDCPGRDFAQDYDLVIAAVQDLMEGGDLDHDELAHLEKPVVFKPLRLGVSAANGLNFRRGPGVNNESVGQLAKGVRFEILDEAPNGTTKWLQVKTPAGYVGWVAGKYVNEVKG